MELEITFWCSTALVAYTYFGYPLILAIAARAARREPVRRQGHRPSVSFVLCARDEENRIGERIEEIQDLFAKAGVDGELIVVSDGSGDATASQANCHSADNVQVIELAECQGKAAALSAGCAVARGDILVFGDCRQHWNPDALPLLLENFADPSIGAVSGELVLDAAAGVMSGIGLYWRYEKWLRDQESKLHSTVGVTGAICAVRRELFDGVPMGTILDDVYWPLRVTMKGYRVIHDRRAIALDQLPDRASREFHRKVRTLAGNFQLVARLPTLLLPWRNPVWLQFISHKLLRLAVPWALLVMLATSALLTGPLFQALFWSQIAFYTLAAVGSIDSVARKVRPASTAAAFVVLNAAAWLAFWVWISGRAGRSWRKTTYLRHSKSGERHSTSGRQLSAIGPSKN